MATQTQTDYTRTVQDFCQSLSEKDFIETFFSLIDKERREVPFKFNDVQNSLYSRMGKKNVILKYRKPGVSVFVQNLFLARCLMRKNRNCVVLSYDKESTQRMLERTEWTLNHFPIKIHLDSDNKNEFKVRETNSKLFIGVAGSRAFGRGDDITDLHISELGWWEETSIMTGLLEALTMDHQVFVESTANGPTNLFAQLCRKARNAPPRSEWVFHFFPWWIDSLLELDPGSDFEHTEEEKELAAVYNLSPRKIMWRRMKIADMLEPELFPQEYPACVEDAFMVLADCIFNKKALNNYKTQTSDPLHIGEVINDGGRFCFQQDELGLLRLWEFPDPREQYFVIGDASDPSNKKSGEREGDPGCLQIIKLRNMEQVGIWHGYEEPYEMGRVANNLGHFFNKALVIIERNPFGISSIDCLRTLNYPNIYKMQELEYDSVEETDKLGWITNILTRPLLIGAIKDAISNGVYKLHDSDTVAELCTFVRNKRTGKIEAASSSHDDRVMTLAIGAYLRSITPVMQYVSDESYLDRKAADWGVASSGTFPGRGGY